MDSDHQILEELRRAEAARSAGNESMARVCARRAAGIAARKFLISHGIHPANRSAYTSLQMLVDFEGLPSGLEQAALHLTMRVSEKFLLPAGIDLLSEARKLIGGLH
jgi:hypothetical protein